MLAAIRAAKGQGNSALYVRFRDATARYWDFVALDAHVQKEKAGTLSFLPDA